MLAVLKKSVFAGLLAVSLLAAGCSREASAPAGKPRVFTSILPQAGLVRELAGDLIEVHVLVGEGQSPHMYEPTPRQMTALSEADSLLTIGVPFEKILVGRIQKLYPDLRIAPSHAGIQRRQMNLTCTHGHDHGTHADPHVWLCPEHTATIAANIAEELSAIDPENAGIYHENLKQLTEEIGKLDEELRLALAPFKGRPFYVFHPSFGYLGDAYGLEQRAVETDGKDPSPRTLAALIEQAQQEEVRVIFVQRQFSASSAKAVATAIGGAVVPLDPLAENHIENLRSIARKIEQSFANE